MNRFRWELFVGALLALAWVGLDRAEAACIPSSSFGFESTNGRKVVVGPGNRLHVVFVQNGVVFYTSSITGSSWDSDPYSNGDQSPFPVSAGTADKEPTIAVDAAGNVGIAWSDGSVRYRFRPAAGSWSTVSAVVAGGSNPSIAAQGTTMHLVWTDSTAIFYRNFPTLTLPPTSTSLDELVAASAWCSGQSFSFPSIAIAPPCPGLSLPEVIQVGYTTTYDQRLDDNVNPLPQPPFPASQMYNAGAGALVKKRLGPNIWTITLNRQGVVAYPCGSPISCVGNSIATVSCSLSASAGSSSSGDFFFAWSVVNGPVGSPVSTTLMAHMDGATGVWSSSPYTLTSSRAIVGIASRKSMTENFRVAYSEGPGAYGPVTYLSGMWTGTPQLPQTISLPSIANFTGRSPQPVFWKRCFSSVSEQRVHLVFDQQTATNSFSICPYSTFPPCTGGPKVLKLEICGMQTSKSYSFGNEAIGELAGAVAELDDRLGPLDSLLVKLVAADQQVASGNVNGADRTLNAFVGEVRAQTKKNLALDDALLFVDMASEIVARLTFKGSLDIVNVTNGQVLRLESLCFPSDEVECETPSFTDPSDVPLPAVVVKALDTGRTDLALGASRGGVSLPEGVTILVNGRVPDAVLLLPESDGDDYLFVVVLERGDFPEPTAGMLIFAEFSLPASAPRGLPLIVTDAVTITVVP